MAITRVNFNLIGAGGDTPTAALVKIDANCVDLDTRVTAAQATANTASATANNALPLTGGSLTGSVTLNTTNNLGFYARGGTPTGVSGSTTYSPFFNSDIPAISGNLFARYSCCDVNGTGTFGQITVSNYLSAQAIYRFSHVGVGTAVTWTNTSDERLKRNFVEMTDPLAKIAQLTGYQFYEKRINVNHNKVVVQQAQVVRNQATGLDEEVTVDVETDEEIELHWMGTCGLLAGEVQRVLPAAIDDLGPGFDINNQPIDHILGVNDAGVSALLVEGIKALINQNVALANRIAALESR